MRLTDNKDISRNLLDKHHADVKFLGTNWAGDISADNRKVVRYFFTLHTRFFGNKSGEVLNGIKKRFTRLNLYGILDERGNDEFPKVYTVAGGNVVDGELILQLITCDFRMTQEMAERLCKFLSDKIVDFDIEKGNGVMYIKMLKHYENH